MLCEEVLGNLGNQAFSDELSRRLGDYVVDPVDIDWHEAFKKLHRKASEGGREVGVRLGDWVLARGLSEGDVLGVDDSVSPAVVVVVHLLPTKCLVVDVDEGHPFMLAKVGWEVGNTHTPLFFGATPLQLACEYTDPIERLLTGLHGVSVTVADVALDPARRVSNAQHHHHHGEGHDHDHEHDHDHAHDHGHCHHHGE